jgi:hypothetical protein
MKWLMSDAKQAGHFELLEKLVAKFPETEQTIRNKLHIDISGISQEIWQLTEFQIDNGQYRLTKERAHFITHLLDFRYTKLRKMFHI